MPDLKAAVIGAGNMGKNHARLYAELEGVTLCGIVDTDETKAKELADKYGCPRFSSVTELLSDAKPDAASVCVPTNLHKDITLALLKARIPILVEKPIASTVEQAKEIIQAAKDSDTLLMVGHIERFNPVIRELKRRIDNQELGKVFQVTSQRMSPFPKRILDVGVTIDLAVHDVDIMRYLLGADIKSLHARDARRVHSSHEDLLVGSMEFSDGALGLINCNWITPKIIRELTIIGEKGMFVADYLTQELRFYKNESADKSVDWAKGIMDVREGEMLKIPVKRQEPLKNELEAFLQAVKDNGSSPMPGDDALKALDITLRLLESAKIGKVITT